ncbi:MAG TPA: helix-turn-helix domain-containing protein [Candidatus Paceibacterota bacterium]
MALPEKKLHVLKLRAEGMSYSQIKSATGISKSTLSGWLRDYPLPEKRLRELRDNNHRRIENFRETWSRKRHERDDLIYKEEKRVLLPLSKRDLYIAGLFLYWGEGAKTKSTVWVSNTDPAVILAFMQWTREVFSVPLDKFAVRLHLYKDMDVAKETAFWSNTLGLKKSQFHKAYIKGTTLKSLSFKGGFGHGTCNAMINDADLMRRIQQSLKVLRDHFTGP